MNFGENKINACIKIFGQQKILDVIIFGLYLRPTFFVLIYVFSSSSFVMRCFSNAAPKIYELEPKPNITLADLKWTIFMCCKLLYYISFCISLSKGSILIWWNAFLISLSIQYLIIHFFKMITKINGCKEGPISKQSFNEGFTLPGFGEQSCTIFVFVFATFLFITA